MLCYAVFNAPFNGNYLIMCPSLLDDQTLQSERSLSGFQSLSALARGGDGGLEAVGSSESLLQERALMGKSGKQLFSVALRISPQTRSQ